MKVLAHGDRRSHQRSRKITRAEGNGAPELAPPNFSRPRRKRISPRTANRCHHSVSVLAGTRQTTVQPCCDASNAFCIHFAISLPYGGLHQQVPVHSCASPSSSGLK